MTDDIARARECADRLERKEEVETWYDGGYRPLALVNPDGPEGAAALRSLAQRAEAAEAAWAAAAAAAAAEAAAAAAEAAYRKLAETLFGLIDAEIGGDRLSLLSKGG